MADHPEATSSVYESPGAGRREYTYVSVCAKPVCTWLKLEPALYIDGSVHRYSPPHKYGCVHIYLPALEIEIDILRRV